MKLEGSKRIPHRLRVISLHEGEGMPPQGGRGGVLVGCTWNRYTLNLCTAFSRSPAIWARVLAEEEICWMPLEAPPTAWLIP